jgi:hypothetical protein
MKPIEQRSMSDVAVKAKTGKTWPEWFALLDAAGASQMTHQRIIKLLHEQHNLIGWWGQSVTAEYERARGLRNRNQTPDGYEANISKTFAGDADAVLEVFSETRKRNKLLGDVKASVSSINETSKTVYLKWPDDSRPNIRIVSKGESKVQVIIQHTKLIGADNVTKMKTYWKEVLTKLAAQPAKQAI